MRKVWSFVYDMLEERQYIREVLPVSVSNEDALVLSNLPILGDALLTEKWANLAIFVLFKYSKEFSMLKEELKIQEETPRNYIAVHATMHSILQCIQLYAKFSQSQITQLSASLFKESSSEASPSPFPAQVLYGKVKPSLIALLQSIESTIEGDSTCTDIKEEISNILQIL